MMGPIAFEGVDGNCGIMLSTTSQGTGAGVEDS